VQFGKFIEEAFRARFEDCQCGRKPAGMQQLKGRRMIFQNIVNPEIFSGYFSIKEGPKKGAESCVT